VTGDGKEVYRRWRTCGMSLRCHDPGRRPLNRHLIEGGNQAGRVPGAVPVPWRRGGVLGRREGSVRLRRGRRRWRRRGWRAPLLLLRRPLLDGPRVIADPRTGRLRSLTSAWSALVGAMLLVTPAASVVAVAATPSFALAPLSLATTPTVGWRGSGPAGWRSARGGGGGDEC